jgi:uncharacterized damage-inducible protein DinB
MQPNHKEERMKALKVVSICCLVITCSALALAQMGGMEKPPTVASVLNQSISGAEHDFVPAAEAMPADKYSYAPTQGNFQGVRTFAQEIKHVATTNYLFGAAILGEKPPVEEGKSENGPDSIQSKQAIMKYLNDSFAYLHKAVSTINEKNMLEPIKAPWGSSTTRLAMAVLAAGHPFDHYGQMVEYLRSNGIVPPASRPQPQTANKR